MGARKKNTKISAAENLPLAFARCMTSNVSTVRVYKPISLCRQKVLIYRLYINKVCRLIVHGQNHGGNTPNTYKPQLIRYFHRFTKQILKLYIHNKSLPLKPQQMITG